MNMTLLLPGLGCVIAAAVGGGCKALGLEVPVIQSVRRQLILAAIGVALILAATSGAQTPAPGPTDPAPPTSAPTFNTYSEDITLQKGTTTLFHGLTVTLKEIKEGTITSYDANGNGRELVHNSAYVTGELDGKAFDGWYKDGEVLHVSNKSCDFSLEFTLVYFKDAEIAAQGKCKEGH